jgi:uncharacterized protein (DUF1015 family)
MFSPFRGLLFDPDRLPGPPGETTSPPYDVISSDHRAALKEASPYNIVRLLLAEQGDENYQGAAELFARWRDEGVLVSDDRAQFYLYEMVYRGADRIEHVARGALGALDLLPLGDRIVGHEETMSKYRADRMAVLGATQANLDPILALSAAPDLAPLLEPINEARLDFVADDVRHRLYDIDDPDRIAAISRSVASHTVSIADGHHRYVTAGAYREDRRAGDGPGPWDAIMAVIAPAEGSGLRVAPYHRVLPEVSLDRERLEEAFLVRPAEPEEPSRAGSIVAVDGGGAVELEARPELLTTLPVPWQEASAAVARELLFPLLGSAESQATYTPNVGTALERAKESNGTAILVAPVSAHAIAEASETGLRFPQKTTYFTPKPRAGLVIRAFS